MLARIRCELKHGAGRTTVWLRLQAQAMESHEEGAGSLYIGSGALIVVVVILLR